MDNGTKMYEIKITVRSGRMREIVCDAAGRILEVEDESDLNSIPAAARAAIQKSVGQGMLRKVDVIRRGSTFLYEGEYLEGANKRKVIVDASGKVHPL